MGRRGPTQGLWESDRPPPPRLEAAADGGSSGVLPSGCGFWSKGTRWPHSGALGWQCPPRAGQKCLPTLPPTMTHPLGVPRTHATYMRVCVGGVVLQFILSLLLFSHHHVARIKLFAFIHPDTVIIFHTII